MLTLNIICFFATCNTHDAGVYMVTTLKLLFLYLAYQLLFGMAMAGLDLMCPIASTTQLGWALLLSGIAMTIHLVGFGYVNLKRMLRPVAVVPMLCSIGCVVGAMLCSNALSEWANLPDWLENDFQALSRSLLGVFSIALMAPWIEELLFRGAIMQNLSLQGRMPRRGIVLSAVAFGIIHINPAQVFFAFLMGIVLGWVTWRTESLLPAMVGHMLNNTVGVMEMSGTNADCLLLPDIMDVFGMAIAGMALTLFAGYFVWRYTKRDENDITN